MYGRMKPQGRYEKMQEDFMNTNVSDIIFVWLLYALPVISMIISIAVLVKSIIHKRKTN